MSSNRGILVFLAAILLLINALSIFVVLTSNPLDKIYSIFGYSSSSSSSASDNEETLVFIDPAFESVNENSSFYVKVRVKNTYNMYAGQFDLYFDEDVLEAVSIEEGNILRANFENTFPIQIVDNKEGKISFSLTRYDTPLGVYGEGDIAVIKFKAKSSGTSKLELKNIKLKNPHLEETSILANNGKIYVSK